MYSTLKPDVIPQNLIQRPVSFHASGTSPKNTPEAKHESFDPSEAPDMHTRSRTDLVGQFTRGGPVILAARSSRGVLWKRRGECLHWSALVATRAGPLAYRTQRTFYSLASPAMDVEIPPSSRRVAAGDKTPQRQPC